MAGAPLLPASSPSLNATEPDTDLAAHVCKDGFQLAALKSGEPLTVFVICPPDHLIGDDRKWLNLVLALICQQIGRPGRAVETVLLVDEFPALGYLPNLAGALEQFREAGLRAHLIAQNPGQILTIYGADGLRRFWGMCENKQFFRITDPEQARLISEWLGQRTEKQYSRGPDGRVTESFVGVPLVRPDEFRFAEGNGAGFWVTGAAAAPLAPPDVERRRGDRPWAEFLAEMLPLPSPNEAAIDPF